MLLMYKVSHFPIAVMKENTTWYHWITWKVCKPSWRKLFFFSLKGTESTLGIFTQKTTLVWKQLLTFAISQHWLCWNWKAGLIYFLVAAAHVKQQPNLFLLLFEMLCGPSSKCRKVYGERKHWQWLEVLADFGGNNRLFNMSNFQKNKMRSFSNSSPWMPNLLAYLGYIDWKGTVLGHII